MGRFFMGMFSSFKNKQVINICDGKCLGYVSDIEFDYNTGCITSIIIPKGNGLFRIIGNGEYVIPFCDVRKIGDDVIMVDISG